MRMNDKDVLIVSHLRKDARIKLTDMSKATKIPVSTIFDKIKLYEGGLIKKHTALVDFKTFGYQARALIVFKVHKKGREKLQNYLERHRNVNSLYKINNGWDFMVEVVFPGMKEVEDFITDLEDEMKVKSKKVFYVIDELVKEKFLSSPEAVKIMRGC